MGGVMKKVWGRGVETISFSAEGRSRRRALAAVLFAGSLGIAGAGLYAGSTLPNPLTTSDATGKLQTFSTAGGVDMSNPFFQSLGTNGRTCATCHAPAAAWGVTPRDIQSRFANTNGTDPIFRPVDGANCPSADVSTTQARRSAYSLLMSKGLIRVSLAVPPTADFQITDIDDPYHCPQTTPSAPALYRRPLPSTNLSFLTTVMWDGRESPKGQSLAADLAQQAADATMGHAQGAMPTQEQLQQIVGFETALFTAQSSDSDAGSLTAKGAIGGPTNLSQQQFFVGINDPLGGNPTGAPFDPNAMTVFKAWENESSKARASVARGEALFNTLPIPISGVAGLNDDLGVAVINGTCTTCHSTPNVGDHSVSLALNIGVTDVPAHGLDISGLPVYTVRCSDGTVKQATDLGRAMVTGKCADVGKTKGPILRGLAARAPYFHNGAAATLLDAVNFYDVRFNLGLTDQQKADLVAFLQTL